MSGGLQPDPTKYEQVVAEACCPMKLALGEGVFVLSDRSVSVTVLVLLTPEVAVRLVRLRSPFGERVIDRFSPVDDDVVVDGAFRRSAGETT
jgi:hypothetical protein